MGFRFNIAFLLSSACVHELGAAASDDDSGLLQSARAHVNDITLDEKPPKRNECKKWYKSASWDDEDKGTPTAAVFATKLEQLLKPGLRVLRDDIRYVTTTPHPCWPQDHGTYGPLFVRLAWHCSGTYRGSSSLGNRRGGCAGGRIRFSPEKDWGDNNNLDKARALLKPVKDKYGAGLSWGDLIILAGTLYMYDAGGPTNEFCFGRIDDRTNLKSLMLNNECNEDGDCVEGPLHSELIYVNPAGKDDHMNPEASAAEVTEAFSRMGFTRHETAALLGGGHAFGRAHGARAACSGKGCHTRDVSTSGFHGAWTTKPTQWDNEYFKTLQSVNFKQMTSPAGKPQWVPVDGSNVTDIFMTNADLAMKTGDYAKSTAMFADNATGQAELDAAFASAWSKLTMNGDGFLYHRHCIFLHA